MAGPTLIFDGDCAFCRRWVERWREQSGGAFEISTLQDWKEPAPARAELEKAVHFVGADQSVRRGAHAVFTARATHPESTLLLGLYEQLPPFRWVADAVYRWVTRHRVASARLARLAWGDVVPATYQLSRALFLKGLALIYAIAFLSFWVQAKGLIGSDGIWPAAQYMARVHQSLGARAWLEMPSLFLLGATDGDLQLACALGVLLAVALAAGVWPRGALFGLWVLYLSIEHAGYLFLGYQWDLLLLEVGLLAIPFAPAGLWPRRRSRPPSWPSVLLLRWLLFRLMFMSGFVKLASGDPHWRELTALQFHYWSQPLPTWTAVWANEMPVGFLTFSCAVMFAIELGAPFLIFGIRWMRLGAVALLAFLQGVIFATGNYGFFNLLTLLLCVPLLDDALLRKLLPRVWGPAPPRPPPSPVLGWTRQVGLAAFAAVYTLASADQLLERLGRERGAGRAASALVEALEPLRSINSYGLFAVMTTERQEILVEGSRDGTDWKSYEFKWKPGRLDRAPAFVAPHMPRLDWQMWFASLGTCRRNPWFVEFQRHLLLGSPPVRALLAENPFGDEPPRFVRSTLYDYRFADAAARKRGIWWTRREVGPYCPELTLVDGQLEAVNGAHQTPR